MLPMEKSKNREEEAARKFKERFENRKTMRNIE